MSNLKRELLAALRGTVAVDCRCITTAADQLRAEIEGVTGPCPFHPVALNDDAALAALALKEN